MIYKLNKLFKTFFFLFYFQLSNIINLDNKVGKHSIAYVINAFSNSVFFLEKTKRKMKKKNLLHNFRLFRTSCVILY